MRDPGWGRGDSPAWGEGDSHITCSADDLQPAAVDCLLNASVEPYLASGPFLPMRVASALLFYQQAGLSAWDAEGARGMIGKGEGEWLARSRQLACKCDALQEAGA